MRDDGIWNTHESISFCTKRNPSFVVTRQKEMDGKTVIDVENNTYENIFGSRRMRELLCYLFLFS